MMIISSSWGSIKDLLQKNIDTHIMEIVTNSMWADYHAQIHIE